MHVSELKAYLLFYAGMYFLDISMKLNSNCNKLALLATFRQASSHITHSSTLAWKIPWTEEPGRLQSMGSQSRTRWRDFFFSLSFFTYNSEFCYILSIPKMSFSPCSKGQHYVSRHVHENNIFNDFIQFSVYSEVDRYR